MNVGRFVIEVDPGWSVTVTRGLGGPAIFGPRAMRRAASSGGDFPLPQDVINAGEPHAALCSDATGEEAARLHERVRSRDLEEGDVERYGRWLFDALLGEAGLAAVLQAAARGGAEIVELALRCDPADTALSRLHWEAMRSRAGFLAAGHTAGGRRWRVAITRLVPGAPHAPRPMASPPRALFVLGGRAGDDGLRPGAELLAVLAPLRAGGRSLRAEVLAHATPSRLRAAVARARPDVVHVIAHGIPDRGTLLVELAPDEKETDGRRTADQLLAMLGADLPAILLLSACDSGIALPLAQAGSFAAQIVAGGVPIVIGMSGRVAHVACRLYARRFGEALLAGEPLLAATEEGRRAAFTEGEASDLTLDWAFPALYLSEAVPPEFATSPAPEDTVQRRVAAFPELTATPVFCGRHEIFDALHDVLGRQEHPVLVVTGREDDVGRTRALKELTAAAIRAGHVPCLLLWESPGAELPTSIEKLARQLGKAMSRTRKIFGLAQPIFAVQKLLATPIDALRTDAQLSDDLRAHLAFAESIDARAFALAMAEDLTGLARDARAADARSSAPTLHAGSRAVVIADDVDRWDKAIEPFFAELISTWGLGVQGEPVPVVVSFSLGSPAATLLRPVAERRDRAKDYRTVQLERFGEGEDMLAYEQVLLHPFGPVVPDFSEVPWAFDFDVGKKVVAKVTETFRKRIGGSPSKLGTEDFYGLAMMATSSDFVVRAEDDAVLQKLRAKGAT